MKNSLLLCALLATPLAQAWDCAYEKNIDQSLDLAGSEVLQVNAAAGDLEIRGDAAEDRAVIRGTLCVSEEKWLDEGRVETSGGPRPEISVVLPDASGWSLTGSRYAYLDLEIRVPAETALDVRDSSGDADISGVASVRVSDSSGDLELENIGGPVVLRDSSGDIELSDIRGDVTVENDSSGDIDGERITGNVLVEKDSSGGIYFEGVSGNVTVERDSSGDITARDVGGDFTVLRDGSGNIRAVDVVGKVDIPD
ncbi:MAG: hypothetical protein P8Y54_07870 [Xanthomonadales bacterium]